MKSFVLIFSLLSFGCFAQIIPSENIPGYESEFEKAKQLEAMKNANKMQQEYYQQRISAEERLQSAFYSSILDSEERKRIKRLIRS